MTRLWWRLWHRHSWSPWVFDDQRHEFIKVCYACPEERPKPFDVREVGLG